MCHTGGTTFRYHGFAMSDETKRCPKCERELQNEQFHKRPSGRCKAYCKACQSLYSRNHYVMNSKTHKARTAASNIRAKERNRRFVLEYFVLHPCVNCGKSDPVVLEFDHVDPRTKVATVADLVRQAYGLERIQQEISLCVVRCVHCHRRRTAKQFAWKKYVSE
jgi:hypothetical protein